LEQASISEALEWLSEKEEIDAAPAWLLNRWDADLVGLIYSQELQYLRRVLEKVHAAMEERN